MLFFLELETTPGRNNEREARAAARTSASAETLSVPGMESLHLNRVSADSSSWLTTRCTTNMRGHGSLAIIKLTEIEEENKFMFKRNGI
jgi:hypothetical protein